MSDSAGHDSTGMPHPGQMIRLAREARGQSLLHLSILLKIAERRLQAFEDGRWAEVGDNTFVRALAQSLCRHLEIDPLPVLQALPATQAEPRQLPDRGRLPEASGAALRTLRSPVRLPGQSLGGRLFNPVRLAVGLILLAALVLVFSPASWWGPAPATVTVTLESPAPEASGPAASAALVADPASAPAGVAAPPDSSAEARAPVVPAVQTDVASPPPVASGSNPAAPLQIVATQDTWVQVTDAQGQVVLSRLLRSGERAGVEGARPLRLRVGNVAGTEVVWQGRPVSLQESQRNNVADLQLP